MVLRKASSVHISMVPDCLCIASGRGGSVLLFRSSWKVLRPHEIACFGGAV